jgi:hypothetical protein
MTFRFVGEPSAPVHPAFLKRIGMYEFSVRQTSRSGRRPSGPFRSENTLLQLPVYWLILQPTAVQRANRSLKRSAPQSINASAVARSADGAFNPSVLAVLRLMASSNLVGCSTGRSDGFAPLSILSA